MIIGRYSTRTVLTGSVAGLLFNLNRLFHLN